MGFVFDDYFFDGDLFFERSIMMKNYKTNRKTDIAEIENALKNLHSGQSEMEELLIIKLEPLIRKKCRYYFGYCDEDYLQMGRIKLLELIRNFDPNKEGVLFLGYISRFISCYFWDLKKKDLLEKERYNLVDINDVVEKQLSYDDNAFSEMLLQDSLNSLSPSERMVIEKNVMQNLSLRELAKKMGKSHEQLKYLKKKAIQKLKKCL